MIVLCVCGASLPVEDVCRLPYLENKAILILCLYQKKNVGLDACLVFSYLSTQTTPKCCEHFLRFRPFVFERELIKL